MEKENLELTKEKMIKSCRITRKVITAFINTVLGLALALTIILCICVGITIANTPEGMSIMEAPEYNMVEKVFGKIEEINTKADEIIQRKNDNVIFNFITIISGLTILDSLTKILKNTEKEKTPFTMQNIKCFRRIVILALVSWVCTTEAILHVGLIYIVVLWTLYHIFKYACQLQTESDEIL